MNRRMKHFVAIGAVVAMTLLGALAIPRPDEIQAMGTAPVTVMNTPLPVALQGTGNIAGNVSAAQSGAWNVGVTSLPAVQLAAGTTVGVSDPALQAFALSLCATSNDSCSGPVAATLPPGSRFVIEYVSGYCDVVNTGIHGFTIHAKLNNQDHTYQIRDKIEAEDDEETIGLFSEQTRIYVDGGPSNTLSVETYGQGWGAPGDLGIVSACYITLSGHLVQIGTTLP